ncbi:hypothetical protein MIMGU_mgv1a021772mg [Erythranthe guttata]|uniref:RING-type E3 ubiquitin transferase n=1 Tax=Erythranthe guttata TaxID=4155 RepID=A0A022Q424_ERYGU|nr:hypothetical protein MIMGU_mgv1a021772mg [Erythranthe guttata]
MEDSSKSNGKLGETGVIELTGKIMVVAIVLLFFVVVFVFCLHLYAKWFWYRRNETTTTTTTTTRRRRRRFDFAAGHQETAVTTTNTRTGLDPSVLKTLPVIQFDPKQCKDGLECAVCLCEVSEGEKARLLPKCNHGFHLECIDMWFQSHSTCPLCRNPVANQNQSNSCDESTLDSESSEAPNFPTNVLIWGNENQVKPSSSSSSMVIDISRQIHNREEEEEQKLQAGPTKLRSLKRLLSGGNSNRRVNPSSPRSMDLEQGGGGGGRGQSSI